MTELLPAIANQAFQDGYREAYAKELFSSFRNTFASEYLPHRVVFWIEEKNGRAIIRQVKNLRHERKFEDAVVGMTINDLPAIKVLIGNFASGCKLTIARLEIYRDFALSELIEQGRFDYQDLAGDVSLDERKSLIQRGVYPKGDWDFDGILLTHRCPLCGGVFDRTSVLYVSRKPCESCGVETPLGKSRDIIMELISQVRWKRQRITEHWTPSPSGEAGIQHFIDPVANSVAFWPIEQLECNLNFQSVFDWFGGCFDNFKSLYDQSLFRLIVRPELEDIFTACVRKATNGHGEVLVKAIVRVSEQFSPLWLEEQKKNPGNPKIKQMHLDMRVAVETLPILINELILNYRKLNKTERKERK